ncbi:sensor domain-containing diguanylate cyclase [Phytobacter sp. V91]|uniref:sensor domain-containing diguanylate cyclase n=1 Tax=Phytobacter sp. V91 TaxID=3369425 RepID=UPI003F61CE0B
MKIHSRKLSFTTPILVSFTGIFICLVVIATLVTLSQRKDITDNYQKVNQTFTHNIAVNYTEAIFQGNDYILEQAAAYFSRYNRLGNAVNLASPEGLQSLMQLLRLMPSVSSISLADPQGHYLRAPVVFDSEESRSFDPKTRPWFVRQAEAGTFSKYTSAYDDFFTHHPTVTVYKPVVSPEGTLKGTLAFHLDLASISYGLRRMQSPIQGEFFVVDRSGKVMLHPDTGVLFKAFSQQARMAEMNSGEGMFYDKQRNTWIYYSSLTNPDWFAIYLVPGKTLDNLLRGETLVVGWGFGVAAIIVILFGLYLRYASRTVLLNILNAIKTGDVQQSPKLEAMLSKAIVTNKEREQAWVRQATMDALTNCKNRRAFDGDITALMNDHQPFMLALADIDNFKSINDTLGHLSGDIVLRNVAREGLQVLQPQQISLYRYGGEEFAILFPPEHIAEARQLLEQWRINVANRDWREEGLSVTFSAGLGEWQMESLEQLVSRVDAALYQAKQQGKNQIVISNKSLSSGSSTSL